MRIFKPLFFIFALSLSTNSFALIAAEMVSYSIEGGTVSVTPARCFDPCEPTTATVSGSFDAMFFGDNIQFSNISVTTSPDLGFMLPSLPNESSGGTTREATFEREGQTLVISGIVDSRAFDGPLYKYKVTAIVGAPSKFDAQGYFTARQDLRKCVSPMCGGIFVKAVNQRRTQCADGKRRRECYVGDVDWSAIGGNPFGELEDLNFNTPILIKGTIESKVTEQFGDLGIFQAQAAYRPISNNPPRGAFVALENKGIFCITTPCFSTEQYFLNRKRTRTISGFDLNPAGASQMDIDAAYNLYAQPQPLIAVGRNRKERELHGIGVTFYANQFYLPINIKSECSEGYSLIDGQCATKYGCVAPQLELTSIGGAAMFDPISGEFVANISYRCVDTCDAPAEQTGPSSCMLALP